MTVRMWEIVTRKTTTTAPRNLAWAGWMLSPLTERRALQGGGPRGLVRVVRRELCWGQLQQAPYR